VPEAPKRVRAVRVAPGSRVDLGKRAPDDRLGLRSRAEGERVMASHADALAELSARLAASRTRALLVVLQGMDASGKDGTVRRCMDPFNPMLLRVAAFKAPSARELAHDFLWRIKIELPERGQIGIFNRSHYEDVLVPRVDKLVPKHVWRSRYDIINGFERGLTEEGTTILKVFLHLSPEEQAERFRARISDRRKNWKFTVDDLEKRKQWDDYMKAYADALERTSTDWAPWHVVPADRKWVRNVVITELLVDALGGMHLEYPPLDPALRNVTVT
jgi:PPK2 family polyphosphate:nucleotide phosphotransferase